MFQKLINNPYYNNTLLLFNKVLLFYFSYTGNYSTEKYFYIYNHNYNYDSLRDDNI